MGRNWFPLLPKAVKGGFYPEFVMVAFLLGFAVLAAFGAERVLAPMGAAVMAVVVALTAFDLTRVGSRSWMNTADAPGTSYAEIDYSRTALENVRALTSESSPPARIDVAGEAHSWSNAAPLIEIPTANGDDPLALVRLLKVRLCFAQGNYWERYYRVSSGDSPVLDLLNIRFVLADAGQTFAKPKFLHRLDLPSGLRVYESRKVMPRFFLVSHVSRAHSPDEAIQRMRSAEFDPAKTAIVEDSVESVAGGGTVRPIGYGHREVNLETDAQGNSFLVTSEASYPGWRAWIDGCERPLVLTNVAFRGLAVPAGRHQIKMRFAPGILGYGAWISLLSVVILCEGIRRTSARSLRSDPDAPRGAFSSSS